MEKEAFESGSRIGFLYLETVGWEFQVQGENKQLLLDLFIFSEQTLNLRGFPKCKHSGRLKISVVCKRPLNIFDRTVEPVIFAYTKSDGSREKGSVLSLMWVMWL